MGLRRRCSWLLFLLFWVGYRVHGDGNAEISVEFLRAPLASSSLTSATFEFEVFENGDLCDSCSVMCKLDDFSSSNCNGREASFTGLLDGNHTFEVCINGSRGVNCTSYYWTIDTVPPTASISAASPFTNALNVSVDISFNKPCTGRGGFRCFENYCNLLVYGTGHVMPSTLKVLQPDLKYSLLVGISADVQYGRLVLVMGRGFCTDTSGNRFTRTTNSSFVLHFDKRSVFVTIKTRIPEKMLELQNKTRIVEATNNAKDMKVYLYFSAPMLNSSSEILSFLHTSTGVLVPANSDGLWNRRFGFLVENIPNIAIVTISLEANSLISIHGTPVSHTEPVTFLYDAERPSVMLSTTSSMRTREHCLPVQIKFVKPVFNFNSSAIIITGGHLQSFREISWSIYTIDIHADDSIITVKVPESTTGDVAGNRNLASNLLQVRHYSVPLVSSILSTITTVTFMVTSFASALLTLSTASLSSFGKHSRPSSYVISAPSRNLMRFAYHIQVFALSKWLPVTMPVEYYEFARGIGWIIPYFGLPWETRDVHSFVENSNFALMKYSEISKINKLQVIENSTMRNGKLEKESPYGMPLTPMEYRTFLENQNLKPEAEFIMGSQTLKGWTDFGRIMFWLAVIGGGLVGLRAALLLSLKFRSRKDSDKQKSYGALVFPRLEIFLIFLALPCICQASTFIIRGRSSVGVVVGILLLGVVAFLLLALILFISLGITMGKLLQYKEVHQEREKFHWYQEIVRVTLGPGKRGQWMWKGEANSIHLTKLGPLFEDIRGPPKYMLSQISTGGKQEKTADRIIASDDETEDAEAPFIQKVFGILRIYYPVIESIKRLTLGIITGAYRTGKSSKVPIIIMISITSFQLFFLVLKKPFIKKKVQLVEIISVTCELSVFGAFLILLEKELSDTGEKGVGYILLMLFIIGFFVQLFNEWYALHRQVLQLSSDEKSFFPGLKTVIYGFLLIFVPSVLLAGMDVQLPSGHGDNETKVVGVPSGDLSNRNSGTSEKPWLRQLRELAKASFSREERRAPTDPSSSHSRPQSSGFWSYKLSGSSSVASTADFRARTRGLQRDLEAIFSSK